MKKFVGPAELAEYLGLSINTLRSWVWMKKIPYFKVGKLVRFDLQEIEAWMEEKKIEARV